MEIIAMQVKWEGAKVESKQLKEMLNPQDFAQVMSECHPLADEII